MRKIFPQAALFEAYKQGKSLTADAHKLLILIGKEKNLNFIDAYSSLSISTLLNMY
jgi:hypothetical protein